MSRANDREIVNVQYNSDKNLRARMALHNVYSTNKQGWFNLVFDQYDFRPQYKVIEFGCGNGSIWDKNRDRIPKGMRLTLTDFSEGMLNCAKNNLSEVEGIEYSVMDIQNIQYEDNTFDCVIANHMLYHVPNRDLAFREIARVLKPEGIFYATTNSTNNMKGLKALVKAFDERIDYSTFSVAVEFGMENGEEQLSKHFNSVERIDYVDSLHITEAKPLADYVLSLEGHVNIHEIMNEGRIKEFYAYLEDIITRDGAIDIPKGSGMFIARKPKKY